MLDQLLNDVQSIGKPSWRRLLTYVATLHGLCVRPPQPPFPYPWEEIGLGYSGGPAFGHWDIVHAVLDILDSEPSHARIQLLNNLVAQENDGLVPGVIWMRYEHPDWSRSFGHPPLWPVAVDRHAEQTGSDELIRRCYDSLLRQIGWFEANRRAEGGGFFYTDILTNDWESGVDEGVRFDDVPTGALPCVDATSHMVALYDIAHRWSLRIGKCAAGLAAKRDDLRLFIQEELFDADTGFFHDGWSVGRPEQRPLAFEGMWPLVVGAATESQARRVIDENLLNPTRFFSPHPIATVAVSDEKFELRMWRGPAWNSMTFWAASGCARYGRYDAATDLLENALDSTVRQFERLGTIYEFYHPFGGSPALLKRKNGSAQNTPCRDYLGHNPLIAMARLWDRARAAQDSGAGRQSTVCGQI